MLFLVSSVVVWGASLSFLPVHPHPDPLPLSGRGGLFVVGGDWLMWSRLGGHTPLSLRSRAPFAMRKGLVSDLRREYVSYSPWPTVSTCLEE